MLSLARLIDVPALGAAYGRIRKGAAVGVDGVTKDAYGQNLEDNLEELHERLKGKRYRHQAVRRVMIPKEKGKERPIGISTIEDKIVQNAITDVLTLVYEPVFLDCSYGFRPGRSAHDALRALNRTLFRRETHWVIEADIKSFFDSIDRKMLIEMLRERIADESLVRLIGKCLHVGILDGAEFSTPDRGTVQGSSLSPLLGNVFLHHVLDLWLEREIRPLLRGRMEVIRYADDFVICLEQEYDARKLMTALGKRFERFGLALHPDKTRIFKFSRPRNWEKKARDRNTPFDFLGFTVHFRKSHKGTWAMCFTTRKARQRRTIRAIADWCRSHRFLSIKEQHASLCRKLTGHYNYFAVSGNSRRVAALHQQVQAAWYKWLRRRSQRTRITWPRFVDMMKTYPLPAPTIRASLWA
jgi:group II intron reverse transcriptase/maturase|tara:strand:- start:91 stop:1326 length:1236 start_codon:yes stop_codon:yes gene_type:complete